MPLWLPGGALLTLLGALALVGLACVLAHRKLWRGAILAVAAAALLIRGYASADLALHPWDERYHALVAKNLIHTPLTPRLYPTPLLPYDYRTWTNNYIWMHKPPLTLWLQAASMKVFAVHEFAMRLPSLLFSTAAVVVTFYIGTRLATPGVGLLAAIFQAFNGFLVDLTSGRRVSDHVDTLLIFLFELGLLLALKGARRHSMAAAVVLGSVCGFAYLTKSFPALLMLPVWAAMRWNTVARPSLARELAIAGGVTAVVAAPWTLYAAFAFPLESSHERAEALRRITEVLEHQGGPPWGYVAEMPRYFGELIYVPIAIAIWRVLRNRQDGNRRAVLLWAAIPYVVFSACATKAPGYVMVAAPALFLIQADVWVWLWQTRHACVEPAKRVLFGVILFLLAILPARYLLEPTGPLEQRERNPQWIRDLRRLPARIGVGNAVVFNVEKHIEAMFYTPFVAYPHLPSAAEAQTLQQRGYKVYVFSDGSSPLSELPRDVTVIRPE